MKKFALIGLGMLALALPFTVLQRGVRAETAFRTGNNITVEKSETLAKSLFAAGDSIVVQGVVDGDVFCAGDQVRIEGDVYGDVVCAAQDIQISGYVDGDIRTFSETLDIDGYVEGSVTATAMRVTGDSQGGVGRDMHIFASELAYDGLIGRDLSAAATTIRLSNVVGRDVQADTQRLSLTNTADVAGSLVYRSANELDRAPSAKVGGTVTKESPREGLFAGNQGALFAFKLSWYLYILAALGIVSMTLLLLFPRHFRDASLHARDHTKRTLLSGVLSHLLVPASLVIIGFTIVGIPLALFGLLVWLLVLFLCGPFYAQWLGYRLTDREYQHPRRSMLLGSFFVLTAYVIPFVNVLMVAAVTLFGTGIVVEQIRLRIVRRSHQKISSHNKLPSAKK